MSIQPLPQDVVRLIGSSQSLTDPTSLVKELIDNAIDARATSIFVDISLNTLDVIQVRDNGHGIAPADRFMVARRYCTSKINNQDDLARLGGSSLGFRGEALSSAAELCGSMTITTRVEGEDTATTMSLLADGEVAREEKASKPIGTTVRITDCLAKHPVRKQIGLKGSDKTLVRVRQMLQMYAFAKPTIRLSLCVLKASSGRHNWNYVPKSGVKIPDVALKVVGKPCAHQCSELRLESQGVEICSFLPRADAELTKASGLGQYFIIDGRPVSSSRGVFKQISKLFRACLRKSNLAFENVKDPFIYMSINCPEGSYDPNIEPAKDDVLFGDVERILAAARELLDSAYPSPGTNWQQTHDSSHVNQYGSSQSVEQEVSVTEEHQADGYIRQDVAYKTNMYDMDDDDLALLESIADEGQDTFQKDSEGDDDGRFSSKTLSNPWITAKVNSRTGKTNLGQPSQTQLLTPTRDPYLPQQSRFPNPPVRFTAINDQIQPASQFPTPRASSPAANEFENNHVISSGSLYMSNGLPRSLSSNQSPASSIILSDGHTDDQPYNSSMGMSPFDMPHANIGRSSLEAPSSQGISLDQVAEPTKRRRATQRPVQQKPQVNKPFKSPVDRERDCWFDIPEARHAASKSRKTRSHQKTSEPSAVPMGEPSNESQSTMLSAPPHNRDIRSFISAKKRLPATVDEPLDRSCGPCLDDQNLVQASCFSTAKEIPQHQEQPNPAPRAPYRRKTSECALVEVSGNERNGHTTKDASHSPARANSTRRRRTTEGSNRLQRAKSSQLPLEHVHPDLHMQNVILRMRTTAENLGKAYLQIENDIKRLSWNEPAFHRKSVFETLTAADVDTCSIKLDKTLTEKFPRCEMVRDLRVLVGTALGH